MTEARRTTSLVLHEEGAMGTRIDRSPRPAAETFVTPPPSRDGRSRARLGAKLATIGAAVGLLTAAAAGAATARPASDVVSVFATAPAPGHPFGIAVGDGNVYVSTSAGDFFADPANGGHRNSDDERVLTYDLDGDLVDTTVIDTADNSDMGLFG